MRSLPELSLSSLGRTCGWLVMLLIIGCGPKTPNVQHTAQTESEDLEKNDPARLLQTAIDRQDWKLAQRVVAPAMLAGQDDPNVLTNAAIVTGRNGNPLEAAQLLTRAVRASDYDLSGQRVDHAVGALVQVGHLYDAIELIEEVLKKHPDAHRYRRMLVGFLGEAQLSSDLPDHMTRLIRSRQFDLMLLNATTETSFRRFASKTIDELLARNPSDWRPKLGRVYQSLESRNAAQAERLLDEIVERHPDFAPAHALLGRVLAAQGKTQALPDWFERLPEGVSELSGYWLALGENSLARDDTPAAVRAFAEATRRNPNDSFAWTRLADAIATLRGDGESSDTVASTDLNTIASGIAKRRKNLLRLREQFAEFTDGRQDSQTRAMQMAETLFDLGRYWESEAWLAIATTLPKDPSEKVTALRDEVLQALAVDPVWQSQRDHPELNFDVSAFPAPKMIAKAAPRSGRKKRDPGFSEMRMANEAAHWRLRFYGEVGAQVKGPRVPIYQTLGCGGGTIDYDNDGRHDVMLLAAGGSIGGLDSEPGELFRNRGNDFQPVGHLARCADRGFSQGVAIGDYNDDGFADMLILNLGPNRLFRNNGDGTFSDASGDLGSGTPPDVTHPRGDWSTSGAIVDVDSDGLSDLVVVNYCDTTEPLDQPCRDDKGREINCFPLRFRAAPDQFLRGTGTGEFSDMTEQWTQTNAIGRGLGIVAGRLDGQRQGVYIVNDASINNYYRWSGDESLPPLADTAISSGLAVDAQSLDQGSMGIASSDFDRDGDLDFYVTGFASEYNILYQQQSSGLWTDRSGAGQLIEPTLNTVGFGTQAVDLDHDGNDEILVTNGHIGDYGDPSPPYAQLPQVFRRNDDLAWETVAIADWDDYFRTGHVGRALFTLDANGDGNTDVIVTHATEPVALLMNQTKSDHHRIAFRLVDTHQARDAVGAVVRFDVEKNQGAQTHTLFRLAGDGYLCSNRPELVAGTGNATSVTSVRVTWPDGGEQLLGELITDKEYLVVRGQRPFVLQSDSQD